MDRSLDSRALSFWLLTLGLVASYWGLAEVTRRLFLAYGLIPAPIWPAATVAMVGVWYFGRSAWLGVFLGATLAHWAYPPSLPAFWIAAAIASGSLAAVIVVSHVLKRHCGAVAPFFRLDHVILFLASAGILQGAITATVGTAAIGLGDGYPPQGLLNGWLKWAIADSAGVLLFSPLLMLLLRPQPPAPDGQHRMEILLVGAVTFALSVWVYWFADASTYAVYALPFLLIVPLAWAALRFRLIHAMVLLLMKELTAALGTLLGHGSLNAIHDPYPIGTLGVIIVSSTIGILVVNALVTELREGQNALREANEQLEDKVRSRTIELAASEARFRNYFNIGQIGLAEAGPDQRWVRVNNYLCQLLGYRPNELIGTSWPEMLHPADRQTSALQTRQLFAGVISSYTTENRLRHRGGHYVPCILSVQAERRPDGSIDYFFIAVQDISQRKTMEEELQRRATTDDLTGAANRSHFTELAEREIARSHRHHTALCMLMFDVDHFKRINDRFGHPAGDVVLAAIIGECRQRLRSFDIIGRVGGEEFAVLLPNTALVGAAELAERLRVAIADMRVRYALGIEIPPVTISIGVTMLRADDKLEPLYSRADAALYRAKQAGRNRVEVAPE